MGLDASNEKARNAEQADQACSRLHSQQRCSVHSKVSMLPLPLGASWVGGDRLLPSVVMRELQFMERQ